MRHEMKITDRMKWLIEHANHEGDECLYWPFSLAPNGYAKASQQVASRIVCEMTHGKAPEGDIHAAHSCGHRSCLNRNHISWKTRAENEADKLVHRTSNRGERNGQAKLTEEQARNILARPQDRATHLAREFGVDPATIAHMRSGETWAWLHG